VTDDAPHSAPVLPRGPWSAAHPIRLLATTGAIPNDALVVSNDLPTDIRSSLLRWALNLRSGTRGQELCSELFGADSFRVSAPTHFDPLRHLVNEARVRLLEKP
jgi:ABC-type phosphate/phosphonate transport system substrate-binding protein